MKLEINNKEYVLDETSILELANGLTLMKVERSTFVKDCDEPCYYVVGNCNDIFAWIKEYVIDEFKKMTANTEMEKLSEVVSKVLIKALNNQEYLLAIAVGDYHHKLELYYAKFI